MSARMQKERKKEPIFPKIALRPLARQMLRRMACSS